MDLEEHLTNNLVLIVPNNLKNRVIKYLNSLDKMYNLKIMSFDEVIKKLLFNYDTKTIFYVMKKNNIDYNNALELIKNMYYLFEEHYENKKIDNLNNLKKELENNNLLIKDNLFIPSITNKSISIYGFDYLNKYYLKIIDILKEITNVTIINKKISNYTHPIYSFEHLNYEIEFIANDIINKKLDLNHTYIYGINKDNESTIKRIFKNYNLPINLKTSTTLFETKIGKDFLKNLNNYEEYLENIKNPDIKDLIIEILNKYYWANNKEEVKDMLEYEFKKTHIKAYKYQTAINTTNLFDEIFDKNDYVYIISFNGEYIPKAYKDIDFVCDNEKFDFLETTPMKNNIEKEKWHNVIKNIKNLCITSSKQNLNGELKESPLIIDYNYETINKEFNYSSYSNKSNVYNLGILLDNYQKYNLLNNNLPDLLTTYPNNNYQSYKNTYTGIRLKDDLKFNLSYSKMNTYFECPFRYYCDNILRLNKYEETFDTWVGSLCHYILSKIYDDNFDYEQAKEEFITNKPFNLTAENILFLNKILSELRIAIKYIKSLQNVTKYQIVEAEKEITTNINGTDFIGIIDKIMHYNDKIVLIDYKTGTPEIDLRLANYGLNLQLPTYIYLIKKAYPESKIVGIYLQHIFKPNFNKDLNINENEQYEKSLRLIGYTLSNESYIEEFDPTYENSEYIKGMKLTSNGFDRNAKVLTENNFNKLEKLVEEKIDYCLDNIKKGNFTITPKYLDIENITCSYCPYKSVCYKTEKDNIYIKLDNDLSFLEGDENESN